MENFRSPYDLDETGGLVRPSRDPNLIIFERRAAGDRAETRSSLPNGRFYISVTRENNRPVRHEVRHEVRGEDGTLDSATAYTVRRSFEYRGNECVVAQVTRETPNVIGILYDRQLCEDMRAAGRRTIAACRDTFRELDQIRARYEARLTGGRRLELPNSVALPPAGVNVFPSFDLLAACEVARQSFGVQDAPARVAPHAQSNAAETPANGLVAPAQ